MSILPTINDMITNHNFITKKIETSKLKELIDKKVFKNALCQNDLNEDKKNNLIKSYKVNGIHVHKLRDTVTYCVYRNKDEYEYFNIDGQHRIAMAIDLYTTDNINLVFNINFICCITHTEIERWFIELNHDSERKSQHISSDYFLNDVRNLLEKHYNIYFAKTLKKDSYIYTILEFIKILEDVNIIEHIEKKQYKNAQEFIDNLIKSNKKYNEKVNETGYIEIINKNDNKKVLYKSESDILNNKEPLTFSFKKNNFLVEKTDDGFKRGWFFKQKTITPIHNCIEDRKPISKKLKESVWNKEYLENIDDDDKDFDINSEQKCPIYKCKNKITIDTCEMGHIKSKANGGSETLKNLRPICHNCNLKMSSKNWKEFVEELRAK